MTSVSWTFTPEQLEAFRHWFETEEHPMKLDIEALAREADCTELGDCEEFWSEDEPAFVFRKDELARLCNAVLEAAAERVKDLDAYCGGHGMPSAPGSDAYVKAIRELKVTP